MAGYLGANTVEGFERSLGRREEGLVAILNADREVEVEVDWGRYFNETALGEVDAEDEDLGLSVYVVATGEGNDHDSKLPVWTEILRHSTATIEGVEYLSNEINITSGNRKLI